MAIPKIKNATQFRETLYDSLKKVAKGETLVVTQKEVGPVVLISQKQFDKITEERDILRAISIGATELDAGKGIAHREALKRLRSLKARWK